MKILVIAGHPADMFDHCGGTLLHHIEQGDSVTCVSLTPGLRVHDEVISDIFRHHIDEYSEEEIADIIRERQQLKYAEVINACGLFGITDIRFLDYDDEMLTLNADMISKTASLIREIQPDLVITHWPKQAEPYCNHHAVTGQIALSAVRAAEGVSLKERHKSWHVAQVAFMLCPLDMRATAVSPVPANANFYVDVTDVIDKKVKAVNMIGSQKYNMEGYAKKTAEQWNGNFGIRMRIPYAEAFVIQSPEIGKVITISEHRMWMAKADERELLERQSNLDAISVVL